MAVTGGQACSYTKKGKAAEGAAHLVTSFPAALASWLGGWLVDLPLALACQQCIHDRAQRSLHKQGVECNQARLSLQAGSDKFFLFRFDEQASRQDGGHRRMDTQAADKLPV